MTGQQLKNSILQMAVQGKLVPQDPNDEPASVLLERIRKEKEQLIKDGKIKKEKNPSIIFRGADNLPYEKVGKNEPVCIADEVPFDIPDTWEWVRLSVVAQLLDGKKINGESHPYLEAKYLRGRATPTIKTSGKYVKKNTKVILVDGENSGEVFTLSESGYLGSTFKVLYSTSEVYTDYLLLFILLQKQFLRQNKVGAAIPHLNKNIFFSLLFPLPPYEEQIRIVEQYNTLIPFIDNYGVLENKLDILNASFPELLKKSILQEAVQGKLVPQDPNDEPASVLLERIRAEKQALIKAGKIKKDKNESVIFRRDNSHYEKLNGIERCIDDEIPFEIPDNWVWCRLYSIAKKDIKRGKSPKYSECGQNLVFSQKCNTKHGTINLLLAKYLDEVTFTKYPTEEYLTNNDIIINSTGHGTLGRVGFFCGNDRISNAIIVPDSHITIIRCFETVTNKYIFYILKFYQPFLEKLGEGSTNQTELKPATIANLLIPIPPSNEQHKIVEKIEALLPFCENL